MIYIRDLSFHDKQEIQFVPQCWFVFCIFDFPIKPFPIMLFLYCCLWLLGFAWYYPCLWENWTRADLGLLGQNEENWIKSMRFVHEKLYLNENFHTRSFKKKYVYHCLGLFIVSSEIFRVYTGITNLMDSLLRNK